MTILTPTFAEQPRVNGSAGPHITAAHEPIRNEIPLLPSPAGLDSQKLPEAAQPVGGAAPLKVALIGTAPSSRMLAPYGDPSWKIWACSPGNMNTLPRADVWFELHSNLLWPEHESYGRPYIEWLKTLSIPVYMQDQSLVPNATPFPMYDMVKEFGTAFFTSSFSWMMALAIRSGATELALYGIDMASRDEYIRQRPGFYFFRHEAQKRGVKVSAPHESDIMQDPPLYAYVDSTPFGRKIMARRQEVAGRIQPMVQQRDQLAQNITYLQGAQEDLDYFESIWSGVSNEMGLLKYENAMLTHRCQQLEARLAIPNPVLTSTSAPPDVVS